MKSLGKINTEHLQPTFGRLQTNEVIITDERLAHIKSHHPEDLTYFEKYGAETISDPDYIIKDGKNFGTVFMVKHLSETNLNVVVRLAIDTDKEGLKNSVMTFFRIREKNLRKLIKKNELLYKSAER